MNTYSAQSVGTPDSRYGAVGTLPDGRRYVLFERELAHSIEDVWKAVTDPAQLEIWAPGLSFEAKLNGHMEMHFGPCEGVEGDTLVTGKVLAFEPPRVLQLGSMRFELEETQTGCRLRFSDILHFEGPRSEVEITNSVLGGWHGFLDRLESALAGEVVEIDQPEPDYSAINVAGRVE